MHMHMHMHMSHAYAHACTGPPACCNYKLRVPALLRAARAGGSGRLAPGRHHCTYAVRVPASGVPYVPRTVAPQATRHQWNEPSFKIKTTEYLTEFCAAAESRGDENEIAQACPFLAKSYAGIIGSRHFGRLMPTEPGLYTRTSRVCIDELGMCYAPKPPPTSLLKKAAARCIAISTLLADMHDVYTRRDASRQT